VKSAKRSPLPLARSLSHFLFMSFCEPRSIVTHNFRLVFPSVFPFLGDGGSGPTLLASLGNATVSRGVYASGELSRICTPTQKPHTAPPHF